MSSLPALVYKLHHSIPARMEVERFIDSYSGNDIPLEAFNTFIFDLLARIAESTVIERE